MCALCNLLIVNKCAKCCLNILCKNLNTWDVKGWLQPSFQVSNFTSSLSLSNLMFQQRIFCLSSCVKKKFSLMIVITSWSLSVNQLCNQIPRFSMYPVLCFHCARPPFDTNFKCKHKYKYKYINIWFSDRMLTNLSFDSTTLWFTTRPKLHILNWFSHIVSYKHRYISLI